MALFSHSFYTIEEAYDLINCLIGQSIWGFVGSVIWGWFFMLVLWLFAKSLKVAILVALR